MSKLVDDRYELLEVIASGGMATVWKARDTRLDRLVALKRPHPAPPESKLYDRLEREARASAGLTHPNLVTTFDSGRDRNGPYLVMELLSGPTLAAPGREIDAAEAVAIGAALADALAVVHSAGIVHRDVKPSNVILSPTGPRLTDFGIATVDGATKELTLPGTVMATPSWAAPEVLAGAAPSPASDVFSLGALVYGLLNGQPAFQGADRSLAPPPLPDMAIDAILRLAMAPDPAERPSAAALADALRAHAPTQAVEAPEDTIPLLLPDVLSTTPASHSGDFEPTTEVIEPAPPPVPPASPAIPSVATKANPTDAVRRRTWIGLAILAALGVLAWVASGGEGDPSAASSTTMAVSTTTLTAAPPTTAPATTVTVDPVHELRDALSAVLSDIGPPELKPKDQREIMERVDRAIAAAPSDPEEAEELLLEAAAIITDKTEDEARAAALSALDNLAHALGFDLEELAEDDD